MTSDTILAPLASLTLPDQAAMTSRAERALAFIEAFAVDSPENYALAADELKAIKTKASALEDQRTGITGPMNQALRAINALFKGPGELLERAERVLKGKMLGWDQEQARLARIERERAELIAAAERKRLADEAAARQAEADAQAEAARKAAAAGDAQAAALAQANADRAHSQAQEAAFTSQMVVAAPIAVPAAKFKGISTSTRLDFEIVDLHALVRHVAQRPELLALLRADDVKLRAYVKGLGMAAQLPGVRVFEDQVMSARAA